jgi:hypothetical protein
MPECATGPLLLLLALETSDDAGGKLIPAHTKLPSCPGPSRCCGLEMSPRILTWARPILTGPARAGVSDEWAGTKPPRGIGGADHVRRSGRGILLRIRRAGGGRRHSERVSIGYDPTCRTAGQGVPGARLDKRRKCARPYAAGQPGPRQIVWAFCAQSCLACPCRLDHSPRPTRQRRRLPVQTRKEKVQQEAYAWVPANIYSTELLGQHQARREVPRLGSLMLRNA